MIPKRVLAVLALACFSLRTFAAPAPSPSPAPSQKEKLVEQLLAELHVEKTMDTAFDSIVKMQDQAMAGQKMSEADKAEFAKTMQKSMDSAKQVMNWDSIKPIFVKIYADNFDAADLQGMIDFYKSPVGQKFVERQPVIQAQTMQAMGALMPKIQAAIMKGYADAAAEKAAKKGGPAPGATP